MAQASGPIGVFDSGVGGLSLLREIRRELPAEELHYVADSGFAPYGNRPRDYIRQRSAAILHFFQTLGVKAVVVACNTATGVAVDTLRASTTLPIVAIEPAIKPAVAATRSGVVGVLATSGTIASERFLRLVETHGDGVRIMAQACPGLVEQVESGAFDSPDTLALIDRYVRPLVSEEADTLVLGCTHYPFLRRQIEASAGPGVEVLDPSPAVARELRRRLTEANLLRAANEPGRVRVSTSGDLARVQRVVDQLWPEPAVVEPLPPRYTLTPALQD